MPVFDVATLRKDFPILGRSVRGRPLTYLDNAATSQKPEPNRQLLFSNRKNPLPLLPLHFPPLLLHLHKHPVPMAQ
jgi:hypothetical protein